MTYTKQSKEWKQLIAGAGYWFAPNVLASWNSKIYWNTLYKIDEDNFYFITSEDNFDRSKHLFSIRKATFKGRDVSIDSIKWQEFETLAAADFALAEIITADD